MMSEKYSGLTEQIYETQKEDFNKIIRNKSYYLIRDLPKPIAYRMLFPEISTILSKQKSNGLWSNSTRVTFDILSALKHIDVLDDLIANQKIKNAIEQITDKYDFYSLLIKLIIYQQTDENDIHELKKLIQEIKSVQNENGSWSDTVVATVYHVEKLTNLSVAYKDNSIQKASAFIFKHFNVKWSALEGSGKPYGLCAQHVFSTENRKLEFEAAQKYKEEMLPRLICYTHLGIMQNSLSLKLFLQMGLEHDERVESALDSSYCLFKSYNSLCYFRIRKKFALKQKNKQSSMQKNRCPKKLFLFSLVVFEHLKFSRLTHRITNS
jgi:hypothetical protein